MNLKAEKIINTAREIEIWPASEIEKPPKETVMTDRGDNEIRVTDISRATLLHYPSTPHTPPTPAVILCPGGGYQYLVISKMKEIAHWLNDQGIHAFVLKYRTPNMRNKALEDLKQAIQFLRSNSTDYNINPNQIGVLGSSAGGHLAARASSSSEAQRDLRPNFTILLYPAYMNNGDVLSPEFSITNQTSPTLIISAKDDTTYFAGSPIYAESLKTAGVPIRTHFFEIGGHGFGLHSDVEPLSDWPKLLKKWLQDIRVLEPSNVSR